MKIILNQTSRTPNLAAMYQQFYEADPCQMNMSSTVHVHYASVSSIARMATQSHGQTFRLKNGATPVGCPYIET